MNQTIETQPPTLNSRLNPNLKLIDLDQKLTGHKKFISCWVWKSETLTYIVDPGPNATAEHLIGELQKAGIDHIDLILLTHIHLDHAGATARVLKAFPGAKVYCHPSGVRHMSDPSRLWEGSLNVLGDVARTFGEPGPISPETFITEEDLKPHGIQVVMTPGHAAHHVCFVHHNTLFAGEALGVRYPLKGNIPYLRLAMPPRFFPDQALASLDRILALVPEPKQTAFAHYGLVDGCFSHVENTRNQIQLWIKIIKDILSQSDGQSNGDLKTRFHAELMQNDPLCSQKAFDALDKEIQAREIHYLGNTLEGIKGYLANPS